MGTRAKGGTCLATLVRMAIPLCQQAERQCPRTGPGKPPDYPDWMMAVLIMVAVLERKKTKSSQYRFLSEHRRDLQTWLGLTRWPVRSTYFERYRQAHRLFRVAITLQGQKAIDEQVIDSQVVAVDKSLVAACGPLWHKRDRQQNRIPSGLHGVDRDSTWSYSQHDGWVQGYSFEVLVSATIGSTVLPLSASVQTASAKETQTFADKVEELPEETGYVLADSGYDSNELGERIEYDENDRRTGRRFLCPENRRNCKRSSAGPVRDESHRRRLARRKFLRSRPGKRLYARRGQTVEPFNEWFKSLFELNYRVWHRGLNNTRTQMLAALFAYQLLVRYNHRRGNENGQVKWLMDAL
jgi:hypothetical protein